jgi:hypothetical protein
MNVALLRGLFGEETMQDLERVRYITENYINLQGIRWMVWGVLCLAVAAEDAGWLPTAVLGLVGIPVGLALFAWSGHYYSAHYGRVRDPGNAQVELLRMGVFFATALVSFLLDRTLHPPIYIAPLVLAAGLLLMHFQLGRPYRRHYLLLALLVAAADVGLYWLQPAAGSPLLRPGAVLWTFIGLTFIITGFFDHLLLSRTLRPVSE